MDYPLQLRFSDTTTSNYSDVKMKQHIEDLTNETANEDRGWFHYSKESESPLDICLVCSSFEGLYQNSGIGTFSTALALFLAKEGHQVTVLYTRMEPVETYSFQYWAQYYGRKGVQLVSLQDWATIRLSASNLQKRSYYVYEYLKSHNHQVVHFPDFEGVGYYSLLAKKEGLYFQNTQMIVGLHGPTRWVLESNGATLTDVVALEVDFMEQKIVEMADVLWTPSNELLQWAATKGWRLPARTVLLPLIPSGDLKKMVTSASNGRTNSEEITELVFFGRLEHRKGLGLFCDAIDLLDPSLSLTITFLGRPVELPNDDDSISFIRRRSLNWPHKVRVMTTLDRTASLEYLQGAGRLTIIPSMHDNAPYTMYEALYLGIPVLASNIPSISALVNANDRDKILFAPVPSALADKLQDILIEGHVPIGRGVWTIEKNEDSWKQFYGYLSDNQPTETVSDDSEEPLVSVCIVHYNRPQFLKQAIASVKAQTYKNFEVILVDDGSTNSEALDYLWEIKPEFEAKGWKVLFQENRYLGAARNTAAREARGKYLLFLDDDNVAKENQLETYVKVALHTRAEVLTAAHDVFIGRQQPTAASFEQRWIPLGASLAVGLFKNCFGDANFFVLRQSFLQEGGFTEDRGVGLEDHEFHAKMALRGHSILPIPESLLYYRMHDKHNQMMFNTNQIANKLRSVRPYSAVLGDTDSVLQVVAAQQLERRGVQCSNATVTEINPSSFPITTGTEIAEFTLGGLFLPSFNEDPDLGCNGATAVSIGGLPCNITSLQSTQLTCELSVADLLEAFDGNPFGYLLDVRVSFGSVQVSLFSAVSFVNNRPNTVVYARFSNSGANINILFSRDTNRAGMTGVSVGCNNFFPGNQGLGTGYKCAWENDRSLVILLGTGPTFSPGPLHIDRDLMDWPPYNDTIIVEASESPEPFNVVMSAPGTISFCTGVTISLAYTGTGGRPIASTTWTATSTADTTALQTILNGLSPTATSIAIPASAMTPGNTYTFQLQATNWLSLTVTESITVVKSDGAPPSVMITGGGQEILRSQATSLVASVTVPPCEGASSELILRWTIASASPPQATLPTFGSSASSSSLIIPAYTLNSLVTYTFRLTATAIGPINQTASATVDISVKQAPLSAVITYNNKRPNTVIISHIPGQLELDGKNSLDLDTNDNSGLSYSWSCTRDGSIDFVCPFVGNSQTSQKAVLNNMDLPPGTYVFTLVVSKDTRTDTKTVPLMVVDGESPVVTVKKVPSSDITAANQKLSLVAGPAPGSPEIVSYEWSLVSGSDVLSNADNLLTSLTSSSLIFKENVLNPAESYIFQVTATADNTKTVTVPITVTVNSPPELSPEGSVTVEPANGTAFQTVFTLSTTGWFDRDGPSSDISFAFYNGDTAISEKSRQQGLAVTTKLPQNPDLYVRVFDEMGGVTIYKIPDPQVGPPQGDPQDILGDVLSDIQSGGNPLVLGPLIEMLSASLQETRKRALSEEEKRELLATMTNAVIAFSKGDLTPESAAAGLDMIINILVSGNLDKETLQNLADALANFLESLQNTNSEVLPSSDLILAAQAVADSVAEALANWDSSTKRDLAVRQANEEFSFDNLYTLYEMVLNNRFPSEAPFETDGGDSVFIRIVKWLVANADGATLDFEHGVITLPNDVSLQITDVSELGFTATFFQKSPYNNGNSVLYSGVVMIGLYDDFNNAISLGNQTDNSTFGITITFELQGLTAEQQELVECAVWQGVWNSDPCTVESVSATSVSCICNEIGSYVLQEGTAAPLTGSSSAGTGTTPGSEIVPSSDSNWWIIVVGVVGGVILVGFFVAAIAFVVMRRKRNIGAPQAAVPDSSAPKAAWTEQSKKAAPAQNEDEQNNAAIKIQATYRGYRARKEFKNMKARRSPKPSPKSSTPETVKLPTIASPQEMWKEEMEQTKAEEKEEVKSKVDDYNEEPVPKSMEKKVKKKKTTTTTEKKGKKGAKKKPTEADVEPPTAAPTIPVFEEPKKPVDQKTGKVYTDAQIAAAIKIQRCYRKHLAAQDVLREEEIEQLLLDIDELLSADL